MKEIIEAFAARIKSPVFGYFVLSWIVFNWRPLFYLIFSKTTVGERLGHFDQLTNNHSLVLFPLIVASIIAVIYPWINYGFLFLCKKPADLRNYLQAESEHKLLIKKKRLEEARSLLLATREKDLIDRAKRDEEIQTISDKDTKEKLQKEIDDLRKEIDNNEKNRSNQSPIERSITGLPHSYKQMADLLTKQGKLDEAEKYLRESIAIEKKLHNL